MMGNTKPLILLCLWFMNIKKYTNAKVGQQNRHLGSSQPHFHALDCIFFFIRSVQSYMVYHLYRIKDYLITLTLGLLYLFMCSSILVAQCLSLWCGSFQYELTENLNVWCSQISDMSTFISILKWD